MTMTPPLLLHRLRCRGIASALLALALLGAQTLGLAHRVLHGSAPASVAAVAQPVDTFGHAAGDIGVCPLYDQLASAEFVAGSQPPAPAPKPAAVAPTLARPASRAVAAPSPFRARAPPFSAAT